MQLFIRYGSISRTFVLEAVPTDSVEMLKAKLADKLLAPDLAGHMRLLHGGHQLSDRLSLQEARIEDGSSLSAVSRLRGGGGDGGSTGAESRSCYLEMYAQKKADKVDATEEKLARWTRCHLSGELLRQPCVCDHLGSVYNKEAIVSALVHKTLPAELSYISSLKHLINLKLDKAHNSKDKASTSGSGYKQNEADYQCPVTGVEFNGRFRFLVHKKSGHAVSERAVKELPVVVEELLGTKWTAEDWLPVNPTGEELRELKEKVAMEKAKKSKKKATAHGATNATAVATETEAGKKRGPEGISKPDGQTQQKKVKALAHMPAVATKDVYASLFTSSETEPQKETFLCRSTGAQAKIRS